MSKRKGLSLEEKRDKVLEVFTQSADVFVLKVRRPPPPAAAAAAPLASDYCGAELGCATVMTASNAARCFQLQDANMLCGTCKTKIEGSSRVPWLRTVISIPCQSVR
jgi:hypothetical protein